MKFARKLFAMLLCLTMILGMATTAFAYKIELTGEKTTGHTYEVYQIFTGDLSLDENGETVLSNIKYGTIYSARPEGNTDDGAFRGETVPDDVLAAITDARAFAASLTLGTKFGTLDESNDWTLTNVDAGYYLIKDVTNMDDETNPDLETNNSLSEYIVQVVEDVSMAPKADNIIPGKTINKDDHEDDFKDSDDSKDADDSVTTDGKNNNGGIGTTVDFELTVKVPVNADKYTYYYCVLNDTLSKGLTFNNDVVVKVDGVEVVKDSDYKLYTGKDADPYTFQIAMLNAKTLGGKTITAIYSAEINKDAIIGVVGNPNKFDVDYSNDPNYKYGEEPENPDGKPDNDKNAPIGKTPVIETRTYVTALQVLKVDGEGNKLTGAEFELKGTSIQKVLVTGTSYKEAADGTFYLLNDGTYTDEAPRTADEYVEKNDDRNGGYVKEGDGYRVATEEELAGDVQLYTLLLKNDHLYKSTKPEYKEVAVNDVVPVKEDFTVTAFVDDNGIVRFTGLGEGNFTLTELIAPSGYNLLEEPIEITIDWTAPAAGSTSTDCTWVVKADGEVLPLAKDAKGNDTAVYEIEVENEKGSKLPETGGMGTTLFYIAGSVMVLAAVILLVTKKRMSVAE